MISNKAKELIEKKPVAISTTDGVDPNISAAAFVKVIEGNKLLISDNYMGKTVENIKVNHKVSIVVWDNDMMGYKITGEAEYHSSGKWAEYVKNMPDNKGLPAKGAILVIVKEIKEVG